jgi:hypothetical protein
MFKLHSVTKSVEDLDCPEKGKIEIPREENASVDSENYENIN